MMCRGRVTGPAALPIEAGPVGHLRRHTTNLWTPSASVNAVVRRQGAVNNPFGHH
jgi:hypothetical protein